MALSILASHSQDVMIKFHTFIYIFSDYLLKKKRQTLLKQNYLFSASLMCSINIC